MQRRKQSESARVVRGGRRWRAEEAQRILDEWATSGEQLHVFAQRRGLMPQRLRWWQKRLAGKQRRRVVDSAGSASRPAFLPVTVRPLERESVLATVETASGLRVELHALDGASAVWIASLIRALGAES